MGEFSYEPSASRLRNRDVTCKGGALLVEGMETRVPGMDSSRAARPMSGGFDIFILIRS